MRTRRQRADIIAQRKKARVEKAQYVSCPRLRRHVEVGALAGCALTCEGGCWWCRGRPKRNGGSGGGSGGGCKQCGRGYHQTDKWIMCDQCKSWFCCECAKVDDLSLYDDRNPNHLEFVCNLCENGDMVSDGAGSSEDDFDGD